MCVHVCICAQLQEAVTNVSRHLVGSTDVAVPFSRLADIIEVSKKEMDDLGLFASILGHVGDGNFHESIMYNRSDPVERAKVERCVKNMVRRALDMEGTCTGEHGVGWGKKESLLWEVGPDTLDVMRTLKQSLDPRWVMNPGKIMDVPGREEVYPESTVTPIRKERTIVVAGVESEEGKENEKGNGKEWPVGLGAGAGGVILQANKGN